MIIIVFGISFCLAQVDLTSSNLPIVIIDTGNETIPDEPKIHAWLGIIDNGPGEINYITDPFNDYDGHIGIEVRGSSSQWFPKKNYGFETRDASGDNLNVSLLGMPEENDWILHGPYSDKSLIRNVLIYKIAAEMGWYASRVKFCEVVLNDDYRGVYVLMEKIKRDGSRVDIEKLDPDETGDDDITGGYIIKVDKIEGDETDGWYSTFPPLPGSWQSIYYQFHYPDEDDINPFQRGYIQDYIYQFESTMDGADIADPETGYPAYLDVPSAIDFMILNELSKNVDGYRLSSFLYKDAEEDGGAMVTGPIWDFNLAFGNADYCDGSTIEGWELDFPCSDDGFQNPFWWRKLFEDPLFQDALSSRWSELRSGLLSHASITSLVDSLTNHLGEAIDRNFDRWPVLNEYIWPNNYVGGNYENEIDYLLNWSSDRFLWMDSQLSYSPVLQPVINEISYQSNEDVNAGDWIEIYNHTQSPYSLFGWELRDSSNRHYFTIVEDITLPPAGFLVICRDTTSFTACFPEVDHRIGNLDFGLGGMSDQVRLYTPQGLLADAVTYTYDNPWPVLPGGTEYSLELVSPYYDNSLASSWRSSKNPGGTPGSGNGSPGPGCNDPAAVNYHPNATSNDGSCLYPGDVTLDFLTDILDVVRMIFLILNPEEMTPLENVFADLNQDQIVDILDIVTLVDWILAD